MIDVKTAEPRIFITCDIYKERYVCEDVLNILFSHGIDALCEGFNGRGFSVVYLEKSMSIDVLSVARFLVLRNIRGYWVIPIDASCRASYEEIARCVVDVILLKGYSLPLQLIGVCRKRGNFIDSCSSLLRYVGERIEGLGIAVVDFRNYSYILRLEIAYDTAFISLYRRGEEHLFRVVRA